MRSWTKRLFSAFLLISAAANAFAGPHFRRGPTAQRPGRSHNVHHISRMTLGSHASMSSERATEIQSALIHAGYMTGSPSGTWDSTSQAAMVRMQSENGWQTKLVPDSRAIIKLGLGPGSTPAAGHANSELQESGLNAAAPQSAKR